MEQVTLSVLHAFSATPGARSEADGPFAGDTFFSEHLLPAFREAHQKGGRLLVDLDGTAGYATSFLQAAFSGLALHFSLAEIKNVLQIKTDDEPYLATDIWGYIEKAGHH